MWAKMGVVWRCLMVLMLAPIMVMASPHAEVQFLVAESKPVANQPYLVGVQFKLDPGWHIYWKNPGESGFPPTFNWSTPMTQPYEWPLPKRYEMGGILNYVYEGAPVIVFEQTWAKVPATIDLKVSWLECADVCIPQEATLTLDFPLKETDPRIQPKTLLAAKKTDFEPLAVQVKVSQGRTVWVLPLKDVQDVYWFPFDKLAETPKAYDVVAQGEEVLLTLPNSMRVSAEQGILKVVDRRGTRGYRLTMARSDSAIHTPLVMEMKKVPKVEEAVRQVALPTGSMDTTLDLSSVTQNREKGPSSEKRISVVWMMVLAFIGGVILNAMPCVFPVLAFKVLHLVKEQASFSVRLRNTLAYTLGVLGTFWVLALAIGVLQRFGVQLGWGFQLQSPMFVGLLALLMVWIGCHLWGLNQLPLMCVSGLSKWSSGPSTDRPVSNIGMGVLSVVMASPCTAPFMAVAIGFALTQSLVVITAIFTALGLGFVCPMALLTLSDRVMNRLPKPGAWMVTFKRVLAVPMILTAVWLGWVFLNQTSYLAVGILVGLMVVLGVMGWVIMRVFSPELPESNRPALGIEVMAWTGCIVAMVMILIGVSQMKDEPSRPQSYRAQLDAYLAKGMPVLVDVTADWCLTCKVNEKTVLNTPEIQAYLAERGIAVLVMDWTKKDDDIRQYLASFGMSGVPLMVYYPVTGEPRVLPQILTKDLFRSVLDE